MSDPHREAIWQRGDARKIMKEARRRFKENGDYVALASAHYSLVKRYVSPKWKALLAVWHMWLAAAHAKKAMRVGSLDFDQVDVIATILSKAPSWTGGDAGAAYRLAKNALDYVPPNESAEMQPHTRAFLLIRVGELELTKGGTNLALYRYREAYKLLWRINDKRQLCRVMAAVGWFLMDHGESELEKDRGADLLEKAKKLAKEVSLDQYEKIRDEYKRRGFEFYE